MCSCRCSGRDGLLKPVGLMKCGAYHDKLVRQIFTSMGYSLLLVVQVDHGLILPDLMSVTPLQLTVCALSSSVRGHCPVLLCNNTAVL